MTQPLTPNAATRTCPECNGEGGYDVARQPRHSAQVEQQHDYVTCPTCEGTGVGYYYCDGNGCGVELTADEVAFGVCGECYRAAVDGLQRIVDAGQRKINAMLAVRP